MPVCGDHLAKANNGPARRKGGLLRCRAVPRFSSPGEHEQHNPKASPWFPSKQYRNAAREHDHAHYEDNPRGGHEDHEHASLEGGGPHPRNRASKSAKVLELTPQARAAAIAAVISIRQASSCSRPGVARARRRSVSKGSTNSVWQSSTASSLKADRHLGPPPCSGPRGIGGQSRPCPAKLQRFIALSWTQPSFIRTTATLPSRVSALSRASCASCPWR